MLKAAAFALGLAVAAAAVPASAAERDRRPAPPAPAAINRTEVAPYVIISPDMAPSPPVLFTVGALPVRVWAPVPPNYDQRNDRNNAANPVQDDFPF